MIVFSSINTYKYYIKGVNFLSQVNITPLTCILTQILCYTFVQACMTIATSRETEDREYAPLSKIRDNYPKYILTRNDPIQKRDGIIHKNLPQFMRDGTMF